MSLRLTRRDLLKLAGAAGLAIGTNVGGATAAIPRRPLSAAAIFAIG